MNCFNWLKSIWKKYLIAIFANQGFAFLNDAADESVVVQIEMYCVSILGFSCLAKAWSSRLQKTFQDQDSSSQWLKLENDFNVHTKNTNLFLSTTLNIHTCISFHYIFFNTLACDGTVAPLSREPLHTHTETSRMCKLQTERPLCWPLHQPLTQNLRPHMKNVHENPSAEVNIHVVR